MSRIACFVSSHGFGHAARTAAVLEALWLTAPELEFELFTETPAWFFRDSLSRPVGHHPAKVDLGLVQTTALEEDLAATAAGLRAFLPFERPALEDLATRVGELGCRLVMADISPLALAVARRAGLPSVLIENFTWDWIYRAYADVEPELGRAAGALEEVFAGASVHIQAEPFCRPAPGAHRVAPIARAPRTERRQVRRRLGIPQDAALTLVTMGGIEWSYAGIEQRLGAFGDRESWLVVPGGSPQRRRLGHAVLLPHRSDFYHPDLMRAADAVVGKLGYSTLAEVHREGLPFGYVPRARFPESHPLETWVRCQLPHRRIDPRSFENWDWLDEVDLLLGLERRSGGVPEGAPEAARIVLETLRW